MRACVLAYTSVGIMISGMRSVKSTDEPWWRGRNTQKVSLRLQSASKQSMPPKANKTSKRPARGGRAKARGRRAGRALPLVAAPPHTRSALMTYASTHMITEASAGTGAAYWFRLNSVYDPDYSSTGTVAIPYNTWSAIYLNYKVRRSTMRVNGTYTGASGSCANVTVAPLAYQAVIPTNPNTWRLLPYAKTKVVSMATNGGQSVAAVTSAFDLAKVCRITKQQYAVDMDWSGVIGANPPRVIFGGVLFQPIGSTSAGSFTFTVNITYDVEWFNPVPMQ